MSQGKSLSNLFPPPMIPSNDASTFIPQGRLSLLPTPSTMPSHLKAPSASNNATFSSQAPPATPINGSNRMSLGPARSLKTPVQVTAAPVSNVGSVVHDLASLSIASKPAPNVASQSQPASRLSNMRNSLAPASSRASLTASDSRRSSSFSRTANSRRSSSGAASSISAASQSGSVPMMKDPRPIREKSFQYSAIKSLIKFLAESSYDHPISPKILSSPSAKDFQSIFKFLYACLDPAYTWSADKKFEEEVPCLMKGMRYPFANDISKSHLYAVGSMHAWPSLLAMLQWMVDLILCCDQLNASAESSVGGAFDVQPVLPDASASGADPEAERMFFDYLTKTYRMFLNGDDHYESMQAELASNFEAKNGMIVSEIESLKSKMASIESELKAFETTENPLITLEREKSVCLADAEKFKKFNRHQEAKAAKLAKNIDDYQSEVIDIEAQVKQAEETKLSLQMTVEKQSLHPEDVDRMKHEKETLTRSLDALAKAKAEGLKAIREKEMENESLLARIEALIHEYHVLAESLALLPAQARHAHGRSYELKWITTNSTNRTSLNAPVSSKPTIVTGLNLDLKGVLIPLVSSLRDTLMGSYRELSEQALTAQESVDKLTESVSDKMEELSLMEDKIKKLTNQYNHQKEMFAAENKKSADEMELLELELQKMKSEVTTAYLASQQQLQRTTIEYDQLIRKTNEDKERIGREIFSLLEDLIGLKNHVETQLSEFEHWIEMAQESEAGSMMKNDSFAQV